MEFITKLLVLMLNLFLVFNGTKAALRDVVTEVINSHQRVNNAFLDTIKENIPETPPVLEIIRKSFVPGTLIPKLPEQNPLEALRPRNVFNLLPFGQENLPRMPNLFFTAVNRASETTTQIDLTTEKEETTLKENSESTNANEKEHVTRVSGQKDLPRLLRDGEGKSKNEDSSPNTLLKKPTDKPIIGRTILSISLDKPTEKP